MNEEHISAFRRANSVAYVTNYIGHMFPQSKDVVRFFHCSPISLPACCLVYTVSIIAFVSEFFMSNVSFRKINVYKWILKTMSQLASLKRNYQSHPLQPDGCKLLVLLTFLCVRESEQI